MQIKFIIVEIKLIRQLKKKIHLKSKKKKEEICNIIWKESIESEE